MKRYLVLVGALVFLASFSLILIQGGAQECPCPGDAVECVWWCPLSPCDHETEECPCPEDATTCLTSCPLRPCDHETEKCRNCLICANLIICGKRCPLRPCDHDPAYEKCSCGPVCIGFCDADCPLLPCGGAYEEAGDESTGKEPCIYIRGSLKAVIVKIEGDVAEVLLEGTDDWVKPTEGLALPDESKVTTGQGTKVTVAFSTNCREFDRAVIGERTLVTIEQSWIYEHRDTMTVTTRLKMKFGSMQAKITETTVAGQRTDMKVATPSNVTSRSGTIFSISHDSETGISTIEIFEGSMEVGLIYPLISLDEWEETAIDDFVIPEGATFTITGDGMGNGQRVVSGPGWIEISDLTGMDPADWEF